MDPRRWSTDPVQRIIGEQADKNRVAQNNFFNSKPTQNSNSNEINPELAGAAILGAGAIIVAAIAATAVAAYGAVKITYESIRWGLNHKEGVDQTNNKNNEKAGWLTAVFFTVVGAAGFSVYQYGEAQSKKFPSISVAFSNRGKEFVAIHANKEISINSALQKCREADWGLFYKCEIKTVVESKVPRCTAFFNFNMPTQSNGLTHSYSYALNLDIDLDDLDNQSTENAGQGICDLFSLDTEFPENLCRRDVKTVCNFN